MKQWLDAKGKLFGLINPLDLLVILILFALGIKVIGDFRPASMRLHPSPVTLRIVVKDVPPYLVKSLFVKDDVYQDRTNVYLGTITAINTQPAEIMVQSDGKLKLVNSPRNLDLRIELKRSAEVVTGTPKSGVYLGKLAVRVGQLVDCHTPYTALHGEIEALRIGRARVEK